MATSGQLNTNTEYESYFWVKWSQNGNQDTSNNRTPISWSVGVYCGHSFQSNAIKMSAVSINGTQVYGGGTYSNFSRGDHNIASGTMWISHTADGTKEFKISAFTGWLYSNHNYSASETRYTLTPIPRQATMTSAIDFNDEEEPSFTFSNPANAPMSCWLEPNPNGAHLCERTLSGTSGTFTWELTEEERKQLRKSCSGNSCTCRIGLYSTVGGATYASYLDKTLSIVNGNPTFIASQISYADTSSVANITENPQHIVQNQSNLKVTIENATAKKEATISKYEITVNGVTKTAIKSGTVDFGKINTTSNCEIVVKVTDSRGNTATAKKTVTILPWALPILTASLERLNNYEDTTYLTVDASVSSVNGKNTMTVSYQYKESGGAYGSAVGIANQTEYTLELDKNKAYIFSITVEDAFDSTTHEFTLSKGKFPLFIDIKKNAVGINDFPVEGEALRVAGGKAHFKGGMKINDEDINDFPIEIGTSGIWTYRKWSSGVAECWGKLSNQKTTPPWSNMQVQASIDLPFAFAENPVVACSGGQYASAGSHLLYVDATKISVGAYMQCTATPSDTAYCTFHFQVKGRWK